MTAWAKRRAADSPGILLRHSSSSDVAIQHAYGATEGTLELRLALEDGSIEITVTDEGAWRRPMGEDGGRGLVLMRGFMDDVGVDTGPHGTTVRMRRRITRAAAEEGSLA